MELNQYDAVFIPGGPHFKKIEANERVREIVDYFWKGEDVSHPRILHNE